MPVTTNKTNDSRLESYQLLRTFSLRALVEKNTIGNIGGVGLPRSVEDDWFDFRVENGLRVSDDSRSVRC